MRINDATRFGVWASGIALSFGIISGANAQQICFSVAEGSAGPTGSGADALQLISRDGSNSAYVGLTGRSNIEAIAYDQPSDTLYAADRSQLGILSLTAGTFTSLGPAATSCTTAGGSVTINDLDSLAFNPATGALWAVERNGSGAGASGDTQ